MQFEQGSLLFIFCISGYSAIPDALTYEKRSEGSAETGLESRNAPSFVLRPASASSESL